MEEDKQIKQDEERHVILTIDSIKQTIDFKFLNGGEEDE